MQKAMVSVIMPSYNTAPWIGSAIRSVRAQTFTDWELIIVDDGSTDRSREIITSLMEPDHRIRLITTDHRGVAAGRNIGIEKAAGEYIAFLDSDDLWPEWNLEFLLSIIQRHNADMAGGDFLRFYSDRQDKAEDILNRTYTGMRHRPARLMTGEEAVEESLYQRAINSSLWSKLFRKSLFASERMKEGEIYEDLDIFYRLALNARKVAVVPLPVYLYRQRENSILHTFNPRRLDVLKVTKRIYECMENRYPRLLDAAADRRFSANFNMLQEITKHLKQGRISTEERAYFERHLEDIKSFIKENAFRELKNKNVRIKNKIGALLYLSLPSPILRLIMTIT